MAGHAIGRYAASLMAGHAIGRYAASLMAGHAIGRYAASLMAGHAIGRYAASLTRAAPSAEADVLSERQRVEGLPDVTFVYVLRCVDNTLYIGHTTGFGSSALRLPALAVRGASQSWSRKAERRRLT